MSEFEGFQRPTTTPVPDELFDDLMADLSEAELKVVLYIIRRTWGFKKAVDAIDLDQLEHGIMKKDGQRLDRGTGLSRRAIIDAIESLVQKKIIVKRRRGPAPTEYALCIKGDNSAPLEDTPETQEVQNLHPKGAKSARHKVQNLHPQQTVFQQTDLQQTEVAADAAPSPSAPPPAPEKKTVPRKKSTTSGNGTLHRAVFGAHVRAVLGVGPDAPSAKMFVEHNRGRLNTMSKTWVDGGGTAESFQADYGDGIPEHGGKWFSLPVHYALDKHSKATVRPSLDLIEKTAGALDNYIARYGNGGQPRASPPGHTPPPLYQPADEPPADFSALRDAMQRGLQESRRVPR